MSSATSNTSTTSTTSTGTIIGIIIGSIVFAALIAVIIYVIRRRRVNATPTTMTPVNAGAMTAPNTGNNGGNNYAR